MSCVPQGGDWGACGLTTWDVLMFLGIDIPAPAGQLPFLPPHPHSHQQSVLSSVGAPQTDQLSLLFPSLP